MRIGGRGSAAVQLGKLTPDQQVQRPDITPAPGVRMAIELASPVQHKLRDYILDNRKTEPLDVIPQGGMEGRRLAICGAGPSLRDETIRGVDDVWACNSALPYLVSAGVSVTAAIGIDQSPGLLREWTETFDVPYFVASSVDPCLVAHLQLEGRRVRFFHSFVDCCEHDGGTSELDFYNRTWPTPMIMLGEGLSVVSRVIGLAQWMGYERVDVYGADCCFAAGDVAHANGDGAAQAYGAPAIMQGEISGRVYRTRPDMLMDAVSLARRVRSAGGRIRLIGDTLPVALLGKPDGFLDEVCRRLQPGESPPT